MLQRPGTQQPKPLTLLMLDISQFWLQHVMTNHTGKDLFLYIYLGAGHYLLPVGGGEVGRFLK